MGATPSQVFDEESGYYRCRECKASTDRHSGHAVVHEPSCSQAEHSHDDRIEELEDKVKELEGRLNGLLEMLTEQGLVPEK